jgi:hypothetical protein
VRCRNDQAPIHQSDVSCMVHLPGVQFALLDSNHFFQGMEE